MEYLKLKMTKYLSVPGVLQAEITEHLAVPGVLEAEND